MSTEHDSKRNTWIMVCGIGVSVGMVLWMIIPPRWIWATAAVLGICIVFILIAGIFRDAQQQGLL